jgi:hypothetical protein
MSKQTGQMKVSEAAPGDGCAASATFRLGELDVEEADRPTPIEGYSARPTPPPESFASIANRVLRPTRARPGPTAKWPPNGAESDVAPPPPSRRKIAGEAWGRRSDDGGLSAILRAVTTSPGGEDDDSS